MRQIITLSISAIYAILSKNKASLSFYDGVNEYIFNYSKSVLQRKFYIPTKPHILEVDTANNPFELLLSLQDLQVQASTSKIAGGGLCDFTSI